MICGLPGSGKTTLARRLEHEVPALYLNADVTLKSLQRSGRGPDLDVSRDRVEELLERVALRVLELGANVVLDNGFWARSQRLELRTRVEAIGATARIYYLDVPLEELWRRIELRNLDPDNTSFVIEYDELAEWAKLIEPPAATDDVIVLTDRS
jgi:predicted kinase